MKISSPDLLAQIAPTGSEGSQPASRVGKDIFAQVLNEVNGLQQHADTKIRESLLGRADLHEAMLAMERAGLGLKVLVQARNKMIQAYEELSRMTM
jgi:flagellar hook-basal body complex protein FliE